MITDKKITDKKNIETDIKELVIARIMALSDELGIVIGDKKYNKKDILESIKKNDEVGKEIIDIQMEYLRDMASGAIYGNS